MVVLVLPVRAISMPNNFFTRTISGVKYFNLTSLEIEQYKGNPISCCFQIYKYQFFIEINEHCF